MYEMYPDRWAEGPELPRQRQESDRPRRRARRRQQNGPAVIRVDQERRSADR